MAASCLLHLFSAHVSGEMPYADASLEDICIIYYQLKSWCLDRNLDTIFEPSHKNILCFKIISLVNIYLLSKLPIKECLGKS